MTNMLFSCGVCRVWPSSRAIFSKEVCVGFTAPPAFGNEAAEPAASDLEPFVRQSLLAEALNAALRENDLATAI